jgi:hypothetical protein
MPFGNSSQRENGQKTDCESEPCERRDARDRRETASARPSPAQVADLRLLPPDPGAAVSRGASTPTRWKTRVAGPGVERIAEALLFSGQSLTIEFPKGIGLSPTRRLVTKSRILRLLINDRVSQFLNANANNALGP